MTFSNLQQRLAARLGEGPGALVYYSAANQGEALNEIQRLFVLLTLCLESIRTLILSPGNRFYHMLEWPDWLLPLRVSLSQDTTAGQTALYDAVLYDTAMYNEEAYPGLVASTAPKLRPASLAELSALNAAWLSATGNPERYGLLGLDLLFLDRAPIVPGTKLLITYARSPVAMSGDNDVPEIPEGDHLALIDGAEVLLRLTEGGQELADAMPAFDRFLAAVKLRADDVRKRSVARGYDHSPPELTLPEFAGLLRKRSPKRMEGQDAG
jgi:hypothetical protein